MRLLPGRVSAAVSEAGLPPASLPNFMRFFFQPSTGSVASVEGVTPEIIEVAGRASSQTYLDSFKLVWYTSIAFGVLTLLAAVFTKDVSPHLSSGASGGSFVGFLSLHLRCLLLQKTWFRSSRNSVKAHAKRAKRNDMY